MRRYNSKGFGKELVCCIASEGITPALWSGHIAGGAILESMQGNVKAIDAYLPKMEPEGVNIVEGHKMAKDVFSYW